MDQAAVIAATRRWIDSFVIELNLCPFASRVFEEERIRYTVSEAEDEQTLLKDLGRELEHLRGTSIQEIETAFLIHPLVLGNFLDYNDFLDRADRLLVQMGLAGIVQIASFHPEYQFADTLPDAVENYTNRSPYPMLHLLREASVTAVAGDAAEMELIPRRNIQTLRELGMEVVRERLDRVTRGD